MRSVSTVYQKPGQSASNITKPEIKHNSFANFYAVVVHGIPEPCACLPVTVYTVYTVDRLTAGCGFLFTGVVSHVKDGVRGRLNLTCICWRSCTMVEDPPHAITIMISSGPRPPPKASSKRCGL